MIVVAVAVAAASVAAAVVFVGIHKQPREQLTKTMVQVTNKNQEQS